LEVVSVCQSIDYILYEPLNISMRAMCSIHLRVLLILSLVILISNLV
jgi:hypothetical protein